MRPDILLLRNDVSRRFPDADREFTHSVLWRNDLERPAGPCRVRKMTSPLSVMTRRRHPLNNAGSNGAFIFLPYSRPNHLVIEKRL